MKYHGLYYIYQCTCSVVILYLTVSLNAVSCDFEHPYMCGYSISGVGYVWTRLSGPTPSQGTGPDYDHTLGSGNSKGFI